jgi:spermidine/putrescine transport system substrate-binding protein
VRGALQPRADLKILCWDGYQEPALLEPFARTRGCTVEGETLLSDYAAALSVAADAGRWDVINLNNPFARDFLHPRGLLRPLDRSRFDVRFAGSLPQLRAAHRWAVSADGAEILGICQRFGPFNLVVNTDRISLGTATDQGFELANDAANAGRFGILAYDDFNVLHIAIGAGLDPFSSLDDAGLARFAATARRWHTSAAIVTTDHLALNRALAEGAIDFYISGGIYTASPARLAGCGMVRAITPRSGPVNGKGGIFFIEVISVLAHAKTPSLAEDFLDYLLQPETALAAALAAGACNPVAQMGDRAVLDRFTAPQLHAMQWDTLDEELALCTDYAIAPDYPKLHQLLLTARTEATTSRKA